MAITNPKFCTLKINFKNAGWTEKYWLGEGSYADMLVKATRIAKYRTAFFGAGVELVYAKVSEDSARKDAVTCDLGYPVGPHKSVPADVEPPNDPFSAVQERFETANGSWINRMIRGLPDNELAGGIIADKNPFLPLGVGVVPADPDGNSNWLTIRKSFWSYLLANCPHLRKTGAYTYDLTAFVRCLPIRVSKHATGRPFGLFRGRAPANVIS